MKNNRMIIGIDPAALRLAFVARHPLVNTYASAKYILAKKFEPACCAEGFDVTLEFLESVATMCTASTEKIAWIEMPTSGGKINHQTLAKQANVSGAVQAALVKAGYKVYLVSPPAWKLLVVGKGNATKSEIVKSVRLQWPKLGRVIDGDEDLSDAACIQSYGSRVANKSDRLF